MSNSKLFITGEVKNLGQIDPDTFAELLASGIMPFKNTAVDDLPHAFYLIDKDGRYIGRAGAINHGNHVDPEFSVTLPADDPRLKTIMDSSRMKMYDHIDECGDFTPEMFDLLLLRAKKANEPR